MSCDERDDDEPTADEARADAKRNALSNIELRIEVGRLKGELAESEKRADALEGLVDTERQSRKEAENTLFFARKESQKTAGELAEATALIRRCVPDYSCGGATEVEGLIRKFLRPAAPPAEQATPEGALRNVMAGRLPWVPAEQPTYEDGEGRPAPLNAERLISAKPIKAAKAQGEGAPYFRTEAKCGHSVTATSSVGLNGAIAAHEKECPNVQVAELAKRVDVIEEWARRQIAEPWFDPERKPAPPPPEVAAPTTCGCAPGDCAMDDGGIGLSTAFRCRLVSNGCEAHREPEAGVPGHAFVAGPTAYCNVPNCGLPWANHHAIPPIPEGK